MSSLRLIVLTLAVLAGLAAGAVASGFSALARVDASASSVSDRGGAVEIVLALSQPVPWRVFTLDDPRRLVLDFSEVAWGGEIPLDSVRVTGLRTGAFRPGWTRMVVDLAEPMTVRSANLETGAADGGARLVLRLQPVGAEAFAAAAGAPPAARVARSAMPRAAAPAPREDGVLRVVLDPGHGGIDPGAEVDGLNEAALMLTFARELRDLLLRTGGIEVVMTRDEDVFVPLETRLSIARAAHADVFLSLHADALPEESGNASGATIYTLSDEASDTASRQLAERHDGADLMAGVDLRGQGDEIALVLMEMARTKTEPRSDRLAAHLVDGITASAGRMNRRPLRSAAFSVLKSPDVPSALVELGFLSSKRDREKIVSPEWRAKMAAGIRDALMAWAAEDAALATLVRN